MEQLTQGAVSRIFGMNGSDDDSTFQPILQIINLKKVNSGNQDRFRVSKVCLASLCLDVIQQARVCRTVRVTSFNKGMHRGFASILAFVCYYPSSR